MQIGWLITWLVENWIICNYTEGKILKSITPTYAFNLFIYLVGLNKIYDIYVWIGAD